MVITGSRLRLIRALIVLRCAERPKLLRVPFLVERVLHLTVFRFWLALLWEHFLTYLLELLGVVTDVDVELRAGIP